MKLPKIKIPNQQLSISTKGYQWDWGWLFLQKWDKTYVFRIHKEPSGTRTLFMIWLQKWTRLSVFIWKIKLEVTIR